MKALFRIGILSFVFDRRLSAKICGKVFSPGIIRRIVMKNKNLPLSILLVVCLFSVAQLSGQGPAKELPTTVIQAGHMLDVKTGKMLNNVSVVIQGDKIVMVTEEVGTPLTGGIKLIDLPNATLLPGLIDAHTHLTYDPKFGYEQLGISVPKEALIGGKNARITLEAGLTTVRNVGANGFADIALRDAINEGLVPGPRMDASGPALSISDRKSVV